MHWAMKWKEHLIYLCHFSISHLFWLVRCIDYPNVMIVISFIELMLRRLLLLLRIFRASVDTQSKYLSIVASCTEWEGHLIEIPCTGYAISMVDASIRLELISIFTFNYCIEWKIKTVRNHIACRMRRHGGAALISQCQTMYAGRPSDKWKKQPAPAGKIYSITRLLSTIFILFQKQWHWEKFHRNFSHTPKSRKPKSLSIERRILWWAVIS